MPRPYELAVYPLPSQECKVFDYRNGEPVERVLQPPHTARVGEIGQQWADEIERKIKRDERWTPFIAGLLGCVALGFLLMWFRDLAIGVGG